MIQGKKFVTRSARAPLGVKQADGITTAFRAVASSMHMTVHGTHVIIKPRVGFCRTHRREFEGGCVNCRAEDAAQLAHVERLAIFRSKFVVKMDRSNVLETRNGLKASTVERGRLLNAYRYEWTKAGGNE